MRTKQRNNLAETARHERVAQNTDVYAVKARNYKGLRRGSPVLCRNNWHIHHAKSGGGQILVCVAGRGYYQEEGKDAVEMKPGDCINIPAELDNIMVPKLTLQPLAENALYHGIKNKRGKGKILIEGFDLGEDMMLRVTDNGQGMTPERLHEVQEAIRTGERAGFGLAAVSERIALYYGPGYGLKISSTEGEGTVMEVYMAKKIMSTNDELCDMNIKIR